MPKTEKFSDEFQKLGSDGFDAAVRSFGEVNRGLQALAARVTDNAKKAFEDASRTFQQLVGAKSLEQAVEIQTQYVKRAYDTFVAEAPKVGELYWAVVQEAYAPFERAFAKRAA
jgi:hypothetical protein